MYELGAADAERGEFNPFYYQHYYYYRLGYDSVRRRRSWRTPVSIVLFVTGGILLVTVVVWFVGRLGPAAVAQPVVTPQTTMVVATPSPIPPTPSPLLSPTTEPTPTPPTLQVGGRAVIVNVGNAALRLRSAPGLTARVVALIPAGREVILREGPVDADGYTWWRVEVGSVSGWCAVATPDGTLFLEPRVP
ncbi:MAG: SH3 domain-containing protein [Chloroflexi bacterium]|nr:MAG: SH3 domain-containing protein [Chloroflexota bacterium]